MKDLNKILHDANPLCLELQNDYEYENEALSVLSRFTEGMLHLCSDDVMRLEIAVGVVEQTFTYWFNETGILGLDQIAKSMLDVYSSAHEQ